jgi:hypothetical protein
MGRSQVNWKFWERPIETYQEITDVPTSTLFRWFLYDLQVDKPNQFATAAGFTPISKEGEEMEQRESLVRLERVLPYMDFISLMSTINGEVLAETLTHVLRKYNLIDDTVKLEEEKEIMAELYTQVSASVLIPAFSAALQLGIIINPGNFVSGEYSEF